MAKGIQLDREQAKAILQRFPDNPEAQEALRELEPEPAPKAEPEDTGTVPSGNSHWDTINRFLGTDEETGEYGRKLGPLPRIHQPTVQYNRPIGPEPPPRPTPFADTERIGGEIERREAPERVHILNASQPVGQLASQLAALPTPGGLLPWIAVLLVLTFALVAVNGKATRLELLWRGLTGGAQLPYDALGLQIQQQWQNANDPMAQQKQQEAELQGAAFGGLWAIVQENLPKLPGSIGSAAPLGGGGIGAMGTTAEGAPLGPLPAYGLQGDWGWALDGALDGLDGQEG